MSLEMRFLKITLPALTCLAGFYSITTLACCDTLKFYNVGNGNVTIGSAALSGSCDPQAIKQFNANPSTLVKTLNSGQFGTIGIGAPSGKHCILTFTVTRTNPAQSMTLTYTMNYNANIFSATVSNLVGVKHPNDIVNYYSYGTAKFAFKSACASANGWTQQTYKGSNSYYSCTSSVNLRQLVCATFNGNYFSTQPPIGFPGKLGISGQGAQPFKNFIDGYADMHIVSYLSNDPTISPCGTQPAPTADSCANCYSGSFIKKYP